jgi:hypothetical protein
MGTMRWSPGWVIALGISAVLSGCGSAIPAGTASSMSVRPPNGTRTPARESAAVVNAYLRAIAAFVHAEKAMDPNDPELLATMTGVELSTVKQNLIIDRAGGLLARGDITPSDPHVTSLDAQSSVVRDCAFSALLLYDGKTGQPAPGNAGGPQKVGVTATFTYVSGTWKESLVDGRFGTCPLGY